jgi:MFS transporter, SP family, general alpha glucoside:H+ symporter
MIKTDKYEQELEMGVSYKDCFRGSSLRRLEISSVLFIIQNFTGNASAFAVYLFEQLGLSTRNAFNMGIGLTGVGFLGTFSCVFPMTWFGRRTLWLCGLSYVLASLWIVALLCLAPNYRSKTIYTWVQATLLVVMQFIYAMTLSPLGFTISSETPSTKLRAKTLAIATTVNGASYLVIAIAGPYLLNPGAANAGAKIEFLWGGLTCFSVVWSYFRLPEVRGLLMIKLVISF